MTPPATRRTVLLATGAVALAAGCGDNGDENDGAPAETTAPGQELAKTTDIPVGGGKVFKDDRVVVTQPEKGQFKAFSAICTHQHCLVADIENDTINCACHGSRFRIADGSVAEGPATRPLPAERITVEGNSVRLV